MYLKIINIRVQLKIFLILMLSISFCNGLSAAPGEIPQSPLFLETVEPNIFWVLDDSGSMEWDLSCPEGKSGIPEFGGASDDYNNVYILPSPNNWRDRGLTGTDHFSVVDTVEETADAWRARNHNFNTLYYNPATTYKPWAGTDIDGNPLFTKSNPTSADADPTESGSGFLNLTQDVTFKNRNNSGEYDASIYPAQYYEWTDTNNNGYVDPTDGKDIIKIKLANQPFIHTNSQRTDCSDTASCTYAEEIQNFANWYTFYRKRSFIAKAAMGDVINSSSFSRMGLELFNDGLTSNIASMSLESNRIALLNSIYGLCITCNNSASSRGTPARTSLETVGEFFSGDNSPILSAGSGGECQQNFSILITDGYWSGSDPDVGNCDADDPLNIFDGGIYADAFSNTLADVAMKYYKTDLKPGIADKVPTISGGDEASHQHLVTYGVALGVTGTIDYDPETPLDPDLEWPKPTSSYAAKIDDVLHAAVNGRGEYLSAQNHLELSSSLNEALSGIEDQTGSAAAVAFNSSTITANDSTFVVMYNSNYWSGMIYNYGILDGIISATPNWEASDNLDNRDLATDDRTIITHNGSAGTAFRWNSLNQEQKNDLKTNAIGSLDSDVIGQQRLNYIRGSRSNEAKNLNFRKRSSRLGDIIHSAPVYVGEPMLGWSDSAPFPTGDNAYSEWKKTYKQSPRTTMVYVGANDGMLHGFRASDGKEVLAYVPSSVYSDGVSEGLHYLVDEGYKHRYYVDATPQVSDVYMVGSAEWNTILVGSLRGGGRGIYALDITNPADFSEANASDLVLWEFTDNDLGYTFGDPSIALMNNGKWAAIFSNGYNSTGTGEAQLFIAFIEDGIDGWSSEDFIKISTKAGSPTNINGLSTPAVIDLNGDGTADRVYAGDLFGNMWAFDLRSADSTSWDVAVAKYDDSGLQAQLFSAGSSQPITQKPIVVTHSIGKIDEFNNINGSDGSDGIDDNAPNLMVFFGTGQYLVDTDKVSTSTQSMYGIWDNGTQNLVPSNLVGQTFQSGFSSNVRVLSNNEVQYLDTDNSQRFGWEIDLPIAGERIVTKPFFRGQNIFFNTMIPSLDPCDYGGSGWLLGMNYVDGSRPEADKQIFDTNGDDIIDEEDLVTNDDDDNSLEDVAINGLKFIYGIPAGSSYFEDYLYTAGTKTKGSGDIQKVRIQYHSDYLGARSWKEVLIE